MYFVFDVETTCCKKTAVSNTVPFKYRSSRIVSIGWLIVDAQMKVVSKRYYVVRPDGFRITAISASIHKITHRAATECGLHLRYVLNQVRRALVQCEFLVAHNINHDFNVLANELHRVCDRGTLSDLMNKKQVCTMRECKKRFKLKRFPSLSRSLVMCKTSGRVLPHSHHALADAMQCLQCLTYLSR